MAGGRGRTAGAEIRTGLLAPLVLAVVSLVGSLVAPRYESWRDHRHAADLRAASAALRGPSWPQELTLDPSTTAFAGAADVCLETTLSPPAAYAAAARRLRAAGFSIGSPECGRSSLFPGWKAFCGADGSRRSARVGVTAIAHATPYWHRPTAVAVTVRDGVGPQWRTVRIDPHTVFPPSWTLRPGICQPGQTSCSTYNATVPGDVRTVTRMLALRLESLGFGVDGPPIRATSGDGLCETRGGDRVVRCAFTAFRHVGPPRSEVNEVGAILKPGSSPGTTSVRAYVGQ